MRSLGAAIPILLLLCAAAPAETHVGGDITIDTTWNVAGSPYIVDDSVTMTANSTLTIEPGVTVAFNGVFVLRASAGSAIRAVGTSTQTILFTSNMPIQSPGDWNRVSCMSSPGSAFEHCTFEYGIRALEIDHSDITVSRCTFQFASQYGLNIKDCSPTISRCGFYDNPTGIYLADQTRLTLPVIRGNDFRDNGLYCLYLAGYTTGPIVTIDAEENYWGTEVEAEIEDEIRHNVDVATLYALVDYDPWATTSAVDGSSWARIKERYAK